MSTETDLPIDPEVAKGREGAKDLSPEYLDLLKQWAKAQLKLALAKGLESELRAKIYLYSFDDPTEGTNSKPLANGYLLKAKLPIDRKVDESQIDSVRKLLAKAGGSLDAVVRFKPELNVAVYKALPEKQKEIVDTMVTAEPGMPQLEIVLPKKAVRK